jgi:hypothetical protein
MSLMSKGSRGTCIPLGISTFLLTASQHTRTLKHLLATGACQVQCEDAYYGHLVLRLMGCFVLMYTSRVVCKGRLTMEIDQSCNLRRMNVLSSGGLGPH